MNRVIVNKKYLIIALVAMILAVFSLSVAYAALSVTLNISGGAEVASASWNIHLAEASVRSGSVTTTLPTITNGTTATFDVLLSKPGDFYEFNIKIVNDGTLDAMVQSVTKSGLTVDQAKYFDYYIGYAGGESVDTKQLLPAGDFLLLIVRVEYRKDITAEDLPSTIQEINLSFSVNYVQSDGVDTITIENNGAFFNPSYFASYGEASFESTTNYLSLGKSVFTGLSNNGYRGVCINDSLGLFCIREDSDYTYLTSLVHSRYGYSLDDCVFSDGIFCGSKADNGDTVWIKLSDDGKVFAFNTFHDVCLSVKNGTSSCNTYIPKYFEYGVPTYNSTTDYEALDSNVFLGFDEVGTRSVCINDNGLFCVSLDDGPEFLILMLANHFGSEIPDIDNPEPLSNDNFGFLFNDEIIFATELTNGEATPTSKGCLIDYTTGEQRCDLSTILLD